LALPSHTPVQGLEGLPAQTFPAGVPMRQTGHGCVGVPVRIVFEFNWKFSVAEPSFRSSVPLTGCENVFSTQTERPAFEIGSGVPKRQPMPVQSNPAPAVATGPTVH
jgi:hypothetical protein